ncbi:hypothetical protein Tco_0091704 [Tanacetum coccineum]
MRLHPPQTSLGKFSSEDPIYDEVGPSYDSNTLFDGTRCDTFVDLAKEPKSSELYCISDVPSGSFKDGDGMAIPVSNVKLYRRLCSDMTYTCYEVMERFLKVSKFPQP